MMARLRQKLAWWFVAFKNKDTVARICALFVEELHNTC